MRYDDVGDHISVLEDVPREPKVLAFLSGALHCLVLATEQRHAVVTNVLVLVTGNPIRSLACG